MKINMSVVQTRRMAIANWTCVSWVAYAPEIITVNVTWIERGALSNASQYVTIYLQPFLRYSDISVASDWFLTVFVSSDHSIPKQRRHLFMPSWCPVWTTATLYSLELQSLSRTSYSECSMRHSVLLAVLGSTIVVWRHSSTYFIIINVRMRFDMPY